MWMARNIRRLVLLDLASLGSRSTVGSPSLCSSAPLMCVPEETTASKKSSKFKIKSKDNHVKIYTRTGDGGNSSLFTGERRPKGDAIFEALGTTDELSSHLGLCMEYADERDHPYVENLQRVQCILQDVGSALATPYSSARSSHMEKTSFSRRHTEELEEWIDSFSMSLPPLENFILPGGGKTSASLHIARSVCRRAERQISPLVLSNEVDKETLKYVNRLSDFLFTLARFAAQFDQKEETIYTRPDIRLKDHGYSEDGQMDSGTAGQRDSGTAGQRDSGTAGQRDSGTAGQRDSGTAGPWDSGTDGQRDRGTA
eukprot:maker-scaffold652_size119135-snap-gene-0.17 protein:Tk02007 transcript:maker-scaffold652_size119135-snap-gene-0.17-mRNA-1 annotation:"yrinic acid -diamide mitochondrial precursor"